MMSDQQYDDLELQADDTEEDEGHVEYDIATYPSDHTLQGFLQMWQDKDITIPPFQREFVWTIKQSSLLIESFLLGLPVPPVFFYIDEENKNLVIDGQQRIMTVIFYFEGFFGSENLQGRRQVFRLSGLSENSPYHRKTYEELDDSDRRKLRGRVLRAINVRQLGPASDDNTSIYHIFERLNTGGTPLKPQEIRNCVFRGEVVQMLRELNQDKNWRLILGKSKLDKHQRDVELILRLFALSKRVDEYEKPMKEFLSVAMKKNRSGVSKRCTGFRKLFPMAANTIIENLGEKPFHLRGPLNTAVLDSVFCTIMDHSSKLPSDLCSRFKTLSSQPEYEEVTLTATTDTQVVRRRFALATKYLLG